jgi:hypothetical protein
MRKILTRFAVLPHFVDTLRSFGQQAGLEDESSGGLYVRGDGSGQAKGKLCLDSLTQHEEKS